MRPDFDGFSQFLVRRRRELGFENVAAIRQSTAAVRGVDDQTLRNVEETGHCSFTTFLWLPEIYKVGLLEMFKILYPDWEHTFDEEADRLASAPSLRLVIAALSTAPEDVQRFVERGLGSASSGGAPGGNGDPAIGGGVRAGYS